MFSLPLIVSCFTVTYCFAPRKQQSRCTKQMHLFSSVHVYYVTSEFCLSRYSLRLCLKSEMRHRATHLPLSSVMALHLSQHQSNYEIIPSGIQLSYTQENLYYCTSSHFTWHWFMENKYTSLSVQQYHCL